MLYPNNYVLSGICHKKVFTCFLVAVFLGLCSHTVSTEHHLLCSKISYAGGILLTFSVVISWRKTEHSIFLKNKIFTETVTSVI